MGAKKNKKICIVDDAEMILEMYTFKFKQSGYDVVTAKDGVEGYDVISKEKPDLAIIDIVMPKLNGLDLVKKMKANPELKKLPLIILTNLDSPKEKRQASKLGVLFFLVKPQFIPSKLVEIVDEILFNR